MESADEVVQNDYDRIMNSTIDQIAEVKEVTTEKAEADVKTSNTETVAKKEKAAKESVSSNPQDALSAILGHK